MGEGRSDRPAPGLAVGFDVAEDGVARRTVGKQDLSTVGRYAGPGVVAVLAGPGRIEVRRQDVSVGCGPSATGSPVIYNDLVILSITSE